MVNIALFVKYIGWQTSHLVCIYTRLNGFKGSDKLSNSKQHTPSLAAPVSLTT